MLWRKTHQNFFCLSYAAQNLPFPLARTLSEKPTDIDYRLCIWPGDRLVAGGGGWDDSRKWIVPADKLAGSKTYAAVLPPMFRQKAIMKTQKQSTSQSSLSSSARSKPLPRPQFPQPTRSVMTPAEINHWVEQARELPDVRWEKVNAVREALSKGEYDVEGLLNELLKRLPGSPPVSESSDE